MSVFVVLAVALAIVAVAVVAVVAARLVRLVKGLQRVVAATLQRVQPLLDELQTETAVTALELEGLQAGMQRLQERRRSSDRRPAERAR